MYKQLSDGEHGIIRQMYDAGDSVTMIAEAIGRCQDSVARSLRRHGGTRTQKEARQVAVKLGRTGVRTTREQGRRALDVFTFRSLDPAKAWMLGLMFGDGNVRDGGRVLLSCGPDRDIADKTAAILGADATIYHVRNCWHMEVYSRIIVRDLAVYGVIPAKTYCMKFPSLPVELLPHFVRGLWDSDGTLFESTGHLHAAYSTASCCFANTLATVLAIVAGIITQVGVYHASGKAAQYHITYCSEQAARLMRYMYADSTNKMRCDRKWTIAERYL